MIFQVVEGSTIAYELELKDVPLAMHLFNGDGGYMKNLVIYGTKGGRLGMVQVPEKQGQIVWEINTTTASGWKYASRFFSDYLKFRGYYNNHV